jgi:hypothetical protein
MVDPVQDQPPISQKPYTPKVLNVRGVLISVLYGIGVSSGLALLWFMEVVRNFYFRTLDRLNIKLFWRRSGSAFPPGKPRKRPQSSASN